MTVRAIRAEHDPPEAVEALSDEAWERLRDEDLSDDPGDRPLGEVVARICRDLGLSPDWGAEAFPSPTCPDTERRSPDAPARAAPGADDSPTSDPPPSFFACDGIKPPAG